MNGSNSTVTDNDRHLKLWEVLLEEAKNIGLSISEIEVKARDRSAPEDALRVVQEWLLRQHGDTTALCLSGGGIRSATFSLGVLQGLAKVGLLDKFDYLSTVSGGGYIGSWLSAWIYREGHSEVIKKLNSPNEQFPIRHLRHYSRYLSPKLGIFSVDSWTLVAIFFRNLFLNWIVLLPILAALLLIPRVFVGVLNLPVHASPMWIAGLTLMFVDALAFLVYLPSAGNRPMEKWKFWTFVYAPFSFAVLALSTAFYWNRKTWEDDFLEGFLAVFVFLFVVVVEAAFLVFARTRNSGAKQAYAKALTAGILTFLAAYTLLGSIAEFFDDLIHTQQVGVAFYAAFGPPALWLVYLVSQIIFLGIHSWAMTEDDREWFSRVQAWCLITMLTWVILSVLVFYGANIVNVSNLFSVKSDESVFRGAIFIAATLVAGVIAAFLEYGAETTSRNEQTISGSICRVLRDLTIMVAAPLFIALLAILLSRSLEYLLDATKGFFDKVPFAYELIFPTAWLLSLFLLSVFAAKTINVNGFSLHATYRNRLIRAYLGASVRRQRDRDWFTGFGRDDDLHLSQLQNGLPQKPLHIINATLNMVCGDQLGWQDRKGASFTFSPLHCGTHFITASKRGGSTKTAEVGYRPTQNYGGPGGGIKLGTAMAISGAAVSPNCGYNSNPGLGLIMMLFNARLGWWLGNPSSSSEVYGQDGPYTFKPFLWEMFSLTDATKDWIYLSDGGHFENLGLYEMIVRRCKTIVVCDGSADPKLAFDDLGNAIRKIRADFGIPIIIEGKVNVHNENNNETGKCCAVCTIRYSAVHAGATDGKLLYIKPSLCGDEPIDIYNYWRNNRRFPHQSTTDQFFNETQFESYRALGRHVIEQIASPRPNSVRELIRFAASYSRQVV